MLLKAARSPVPLVGDDNAPGCHNPYAPFSAYLFTFACVAALLLAKECRLETSWSIGHHTPSTIADPPRALQGVPFGITLSSPSVSVKLPPRMWWSLPSSGKAESISKPGY